MTADAPCRCRQTVLGRPKGAMDKSEVVDASGEIYGEYVQASQSDRCAMPQLLHCAYRRPRAEARLRDHGCPVACPYRHAPAFAAHRTSPAHRARILAGIAEVDKSTSPR